MSEAWKQELEEAQEIVAHFTPNEDRYKRYRKGEANYLPVLANAIDGLGPICSALDIGPGWGTMAVWLSRRQVPVVVLDREPIGTFIDPMLRQEAGFSYVVGDIEDKALPGRFNLVMLTQVIPHLAWRPDRALQNAKQMVVPGGYFVATAIGEEYIEKRHAGTVGAFGTNWRDVPEFETADRCEEMVKCMYTIDSFSDLLSSVFDDVNAWTENRIHFAVCR